jgi:NADH-quinone oxidoreductase subunit L
MFANYAWLIMLLPLVAFIVLIAFSRSFRGAAQLIGNIWSAAALILALLVLGERFGAGVVPYQSSFTWLQFGDFSLTLGFEVTNLTALMLVVVTAVSFLVNLYSSGYMKGDERITVFYAYLALFSFSMLGLVLSDNLFMLYIFWELVGVCSFLLIGFWFQKPAAKAAAKKAFIVTRIGDAGLLIGILLLYWNMPDHQLDFVSISNVFSNPELLATAGIGAGLTTAIALMIFLGAVGKSGQFPLHVWLPDAMEGPTPVSALIHAATMVAAGVFLVARTFDIFLASPAALETVAYIGGFTAIFAALIATAQSDIKRILAYSTVSQLGYMMLALGLGSLVGGMFHLFTHAFFKALLFLGAGSIIHAVVTQDINEMGGVGKKMKTTMITFGIGTLALSGIPPFSGFWSKDLILTTAWNSNKVLFVVAIVAAFLTALYMARLFFLTFTGKPRTEEASHAHESPKTMTIPLIILAVLAVVTGFLGMPWKNFFEEWFVAGGITQAAEAGAHEGSTVIMILSAVVGIIGLYVGWLIYGKGTIRRASQINGMRGIHRLLANKFYIDELYHVIFVRGFKFIGSILQVIDRFIIDGIVRLIGAIAILFGRGETTAQNGQIQTYGIVTVFGLVILLLAVAGRRFWGL